MKVKLDQYEKNIDKKSSQYLPITEKKKKVIENIIENSRSKSKNINIRISDSDLNKIKERSLREGLPYQTLITSIIHKYVTDQFIEESQIEKVAKALLK
jgi:predicted DNA binding CopG/RHH family protein